MTKKQILEDDAGFSAALPQVHVISASAGSGKTYTLTQRYIQLLLSNRIKSDGADTNDPTNILAVTFTRNAAKEMKSRILEWLGKMALNTASQEFKNSLDLLKEDPSVISKRASERMVYLLDHYDDFNVKTIDKFMTSVMRASSNELRVSPDQTITTSYDELIDAAIYLIFSNLDREITREEIDDFLNRIPTKGSYKWNPINDVRSEFKNFLSVEGKLSGAIKPGGSKLHARIKTCFMELLETSKELAAEVPLANVSEEALAIIHEPLTEPNLEDHIFRFMGSLRTHAILTGLRQSTIHKNISRKALELLARFREQYAELLVLRSETHYDAYTGVFDKFRCRLEDLERSKTGTIHIQDVSKRLSKYIDQGSVPEIYFRLGDRIWHYLIDEFQDTDVIQWRNFRHLVEESLSRKGSLLVVGDLKQAIYMFRNADYRIMKNMIDAASGTPESEVLSLGSLKSGIKVSHLPINYRSDGVIVQYVEKLFKKSLPIADDNDKTGLKTFSQSVDAGREERGYVHEIKVQYSGDDREEVRKQLLALIGAEGSAGLLKRYRARDVLVLAEKNKTVAEAIEWLSSAGIPVAASSSLDIRHRKIMSEMISLLRFLDSPIDDLAFGEFIAGDIFTSASKMKRDDVTRLMLLWHMEKAPCFYSWLKERPEFKNLWNNYFERIFSRAGYIGVYELLSEAMIAFKVLENFTDESAFLVRFLDAANELQNRGAGGVKDFLEQIDEEYDEESKSLFSINLPDYVNAVRVMTFHAAKGLGYPVVVNLIYNDRNRNDNMYMSSDGNEIKLYHITKREEENSAKLKAIKAAKHLDDTIQMNNLFYVITTRAKHEMINLFAEKKKGSDHENADE